MDISEMMFIGSGAEADIYRYGNRAVKVFKDMRPKSVACREAALQNKAYMAGLPVPAIYEVTEVNGKTAIIMEYIDGKPLGDDMLSDLDKAPYYLDLSVGLHMKIHEVVASDFPCQKERLKRNLQENSFLDSKQKDKLLHLLKTLESGDKLCHGDFHVLNLLQTNDSIKIIDWICASKGNPLADVCRTYLLYLLYRSELAAMYIAIYCNKSGIQKEEILSWLPVIAGARLNENVSEKDVSLILDIVNGFIN